MSHSCRLTSELTGAQGTEARLAARTHLCVRVEQPVRRQLSVRHHSPYDERNPSAPTIPPPTKHAKAA
jgi:hypothetical protein